MIISPSHGFAFIHIPKCAGSSIRGQIAPFDEDERFSGRSGMGDFSYITMSHLTMPMLRAHFPDALEMIRGLEAFAVIRNPQHRFRSAIAQFFRNFRGKRIGEVTETEMRAALDEIFAALETGMAAPPDHVIHFTPQVDYVFLDGEQIANRLYRLEDLPAFCEALGARTGTTVLPDLRRNQTVALRYPGASDMIWKINNRLIATFAQGRLLARQEGRAAVPDPIARPEGEPGSRRSRRAALHRRQVSCRFRPLRKPSAGAR